MRLNQRGKWIIVLLLAWIFLACEEETTDYAADLIGNYIVESETISGTYTAYTSSPPEESRLIDITREFFISYKNDENHCDTTYQVETWEIDSFSDTSIFLADGSRLYYALESGVLTLYDDDDIINLIEYDGEFPPPAWNNLDHLENDSSEPDGSFATATRIAAAGTSREHFMGVCDDQDYFIFEALAGTIYILEAVSLTNNDMDLTLTLFTSAGDTAGFNDDQTEGNMDPELEWMCPDSGDYYFGIQKYWDYLDPGNSLDDEKGAYTVTVDVTKALLNAPPQAIIKRSKPPRSTQLSHELFD